MRVWSLLAVIVAVDAFPHGGNTSDEVVQAMIVQLLYAGAGGEQDTSEHGNETMVDVANATDVVAGNLTEDRSMSGGSMLRNAEVNGFENNWWDIAPEHTRTAFKKCCVDRGSMDEECMRYMCDWEATHRMEIGRPLKMLTSLNGKRCIEDLRQLADYLFCYSGGQDNTDCCNAAKVKTQACLDLCAGTLPPEGMNSRAFKGENMRRT